MPYEYLDDEAIADTAINAWGKDLSELFTAACEAVSDIMIDRSSLSPTQSHQESFQETTIDMLLFEVLNELILIKDADQFFYKMINCRVTIHNDEYHATLSGMGETLNIKKHRLGADIKAITLHDFRIWQENHTWWAHFIVDI